MSISNIEYPNDINLYCNSMNFGNPPNSAFQKYVQAGYSTNTFGPFNGSSIGLFRQLDRVCSFSIAGVAGTFSVSAPIGLSTPLPQPPNIVLYYPIWVLDNNVRVLGTLKIDTSGNMIIYKNFSDNFTAGACGFDSFSISYCSFI